MKFSTRPQHPDHRLNPRYWWNQDKAQTHYFVSELHKHYPLMREGWHNSTLICPPGRVLLMPHHYYTIHVRDGDPRKKNIIGAWLTDEMVEMFPPKMFTKGGALGEPI